MPAAPAPALPRGPPTSVERVMWTFGAVVFLLVLGSLSQLWGALGSSRAEHDRTDDER